MRKIDYKKELKHLYNASAAKVAIVEVPQMNFLMVDGLGDPNTSQEFQGAVEALFGLSYTLKFMIKKSELAIDYGVLPLEGLWWTEKMSDFNVDDKDSWQWTVMIMQPEYVTAPMLREAIRQVEKKKGAAVLHKVRLEAFCEGRAAQMMHVGPFAEEGPTIEKIHGFIEDNGFKRSGKHHEIYLSDIRRADPAKWKTIIRQPFA